MYVLPSIICDGRAAPKAFGVGREFNSPLLLLLPTTATLFPYTTLFRSHYIGSTIDFERRFAQHLRGHTATTKRLGERLEVVALKEFETLEEARKVGRHLWRQENVRLAIHYLRR